MKKYRVLIVEDEVKISKIINMYLEKEGIETFSAYNGVEALKLFKETSPHLICLDIMMPLKDGWEVAKEVRAVSNVPIIMLTALQSEDDILKGYTFKIDDYVVKPVSPKVLIAKIKNILEKQKDDISVITEVKVGELLIKIDEHKIFLAGEELKLSKTEYDLLLFFARNVNKICPRNLLLDEIWGESVYIDDRIIDTYVKNLRKLLKNFDYIKTVFGVGYRFEV